MDSSPSNPQRYDHSINPNQLEDLDLPISSGVLPYIDTAAPKQKKDRKSNAATGASAASVRAFTAQAVAFYFRAPVKAFFRTRVDYLVYARSVSQSAADAAAVGGGGRYISWTQIWKNSTAGLLTNAVRVHGWRVIPEQVLPPLVANVAVGAVLYTSYLQILGRLHEPSGEVRRSVYPPPGWDDTFMAGFAAGGFQSVVAAPLDALMVRYERRFNAGVGDGKTMVAYGREKLGEIGVRGIFAGWTLSFVKDTLGSGVFFSTFEWIKAQGYYRFVRWYYGELGLEVVNLLAERRPDERSKARREKETKMVITPHYALEPTFLLLAGVTATITQQGVLFPLTMLQQRHFERLEDLDAQARNINNTEAAHRRKGRMLRAYLNAYQRTLSQCTVEAAPYGGMRKWLYRGFWWTTIRQVPSTSAGLIMFELFRRKYGLDSDEVRISQDGYDILLK